MASASQQLSTTSAGGEVTGLAATTAAAAATTTTTTSAKTTTMQTCAECGQAPATVRTTSLSTYISSRESRIKLLTLNSCRRPATSAMQYTIQVLKNYHCIKAWNPKKSVNVYNYILKKVRKRAHLWPSPNFSAGRERPVGLHNGRRAKTNYLHNGDNTAIQIRSKSQGLNSGGRSRGRNRAVQLWGWWRRRRRRRRRWRWPQ